MHLPPRPQSPGHQVRAGLSVLGGDSWFLVLLYKSLQDPSEQRGLQDLPWHRRSQPEQLEFEIFFSNLTCQSKGKAIDFGLASLLLITCLFKDFSDLIEGQIFVPTSDIISYSIQDSWDHILTGGPNDPQSFGHMSSVSLLMVQSWTPLPFQELSVHKVMISVNPSLQR